MCNYNGRKVSRAEFIRLKELEKELSNAQEDTEVAHGYDYGDWPIVRPTKTGKININRAHWEFIPDFVQTKANLPRFRAAYNTLNARGETLLGSAMYGQAALTHRCLVLNTHFYDYRHIGKKKIPYRVSVKDCKHFFVAGIWRIWTDRADSQQLHTFSMITTEANSLMAQIHNTKKRMPTILPESLAHDWLFKPLTPLEVRQIATYQLPSEQMQAWTVGKDFMKPSGDPDKEVIYEGIPALQY